MLWEMVVEWAWIETVFIYHQYINSFVFAVYKSEKFDKLVNKLLIKPEKEELQRFIDELKAGNIVGQPLTFDFFREKKIGGERVYFLVYPDEKIVLLVSASNKKAQQDTIDEIKKMIPEYRKIVEKIVSTS